MGCGASAQGGAESVQLQRDLEQARGKIDALEAERASQAAAAREKMDALEAELQAARASQATAGPRPEATVRQGVAASNSQVVGAAHCLATSASSPVAAAFEAARVAPDAVRISGATKADGTPDFYVNGIFQKKGDMRNRRALYVKMGSHPLDIHRACCWFAAGLWFDDGGDDGHWCVGGMDDAGTDVWRASTSAATTTSSPDCAMVTWKVKIEGTPVLQTSIKVQVVIEEDIAADTKRREGQEAADHAEAAEFVRIAGATDAYDNPLTYVNGDYHKLSQKEMRNGRPVYEKISNFVNTEPGGRSAVARSLVGAMSEDTGIGLWCDAFGDWSVGNMCDAVRKSQTSNTNHRNSA